MAALKIIGILLLIVLLLGLLRVGATITFAEETVVKLRIGPLRLTLLPKKKKKPKREKQPKKEPAPEEKKGKRAHKLPRLTLRDVPELVSAVFSALHAALRRVCKRLRIDPMEVTVVFGGADPADVAEAYGIANAVVFSLMPKAEEIFYLPDPAIHLRMDYGAEATRCEGKVGISGRICDAFAILFALAAPLIKWFLRLKKAHANDPKPAEKTGEATTNPTEQTTEKLSA